MRILILVLLFNPFNSFGQYSSHIISGIDLNKDWYTLTNQSQLSYVINENVDYQSVSMDIDKNYLNSNVDKDFIDIGFTSLVLSFPNLNQSNLDVLKPTMLVASLKYESDYVYSKNSSKDFNQIVYLLMNQFGTPNSSMKKDWGSAFDWKFDNAQLMLNSNKTAHISLVYLKLE